MGKRSVWILVGAFVLATAVELWADDARPPRPEEEFAAWPVDTAIEAQAECLHPESWRTSQHETATRFAREILRLENPKVTVDSSADYPSAAVRWDVLDVGISMRQAYGCWYVTSARHREDFDSGDVGAYAGLPPNRVLFVTLPPGRSDGARVAGSFGSGFETREFDVRVQPGDPARPITVPANAYLPGHYMSVGFGYPTVETIPAPPDPSSSVRVPPVPTVKDMLSNQLAIPGAGGCRRWWLGGEDPGRGANRYLWLAEPRGDGRRSHTDPIGAGKGDVRATLDGVPVEFDFWRPTKGCSVLGRVTSGGDHPERVRSVRVDDDAFFFDVEWGHATHAEFTYSYGNNEWDHGAVPIRNPLSFNTYAPYDNTHGGYYFVTFYDDNRVLSVEGGALPPVEMIRDPASPELDTKARPRPGEFGPDGPSRGTDS